MTTGLYWHSAATRHLTPDGHPEQVARAHSVEAALAGLELDRREAPLADEADLLRCHPQSYLDRIRAQVPAGSVVALDGDTYLSAGSFECASRAVGGAVAAVDAVLAGQLGNAFVAMRPPGHHATHDTAMGFCLLSTVAIATMRALDHHGLERVAVLDFDVHHGNGTQDLLWNESRVLFASSHQMPLFPGSGAASEQGAHGQIVNKPLAPGTGGPEARQAWDQIIARARRFDPQLVIVSAGFDAHAADPLGQLNWSEADFVAVTRAICDMAAECGAPVVSSLEGGYDLAALGRSVRAHVETLIEAQA